MDESNGGKEKANVWEINQTFMALMADARLAVLEQRIAHLESLDRPQDSAKTLNEMRRQIAELVNAQIAGYADHRPNEAAHFAQMLAAWKAKHQI